MNNLYDITDPNPCALVESLRSVGYSLSTALADIIDNSITAEATVITLDFHWAGNRSLISVLDNGIGMDAQGLQNAMRPGTKSPREFRDPNDLGRFGLGLKTASFSQCRVLSVWSHQKKTQVDGRKWDLDYVAEHNQWRLEKGMNPPDSRAFKNLNNFESGTLVIWETIDRLVDDSSVDSHEAHSRFLNSIEDVKQYLSMIFHRHLSGHTLPRRLPLKIYVNGDSDQHLLQPWDPFHISNKVFPQESPIEKISYKGEIISVRGYVLPHKDKLTEQEFVHGAGQRGWVAHQGFYIYRNDRIILAGDWLKLGRGKTWPKEEQYKLARMSIDIPNSMDLDWSLDVKKSTARPPPRLRVRLTELAEKIRYDARKVFTHRGHYGHNPAAPTLIIEKPWNAEERNSHIVYRINRKHPLIQVAFKKLGPLASELETVCRLVEETVPIQRIWLDTAESSLDHGIPYEGLAPNLIQEDIRKAYQFLRMGNSDNETIRSLLLATEPFNRYPDSVNQIMDEE